MNKSFECCAIHKQLSRHINFFQFRHIFHEDTLTLTSPTDLFLNDHPRFLAQREHVSLTPQGSVLHL